MKVGFAQVVKPAVRLNGSFDVAPVIRQGSIPDLFRRFPAAWMAVPADIPEVCLLAASSGTLRVLHFGTLVVSRHVVSKGRTAPRPCGFAYVAEDWPVQSGKPKPLTRIERRYNAADAAIVNRNIRCIDAATKAGALSHEG